MQPQIIVLREGTESGQGRDQIVSNINACQLVADSVRTTLGPRGMDKLIVDSKGAATISNDGATVLKSIDVVHPAARILVDIAVSQDAEVGDGTTSVVLLAAELLLHCKTFIEDGLHPTVIVSGLRKASRLCSEKINAMAIPWDVESEAKRDVLLKCAATAMSSKLIHQHKDRFSQIVVDAVLKLDNMLSLDMIGIKKVQGGGLEDSELVEGVAFQKTFSYAGFEMQPKLYNDAKVALLNIELELKAERDNAEVRVDNVETYQKVVDAEWSILYEKLDKIHACGAKIVLSKLPIGDVATQYFADRDMFCAGRVPEQDLRRTLKACGGSILTTVNAIADSDLGRCGRFEERQVGGCRYNYFLHCAKAKACTIILRGGADQFLAETERSLHDALCVVRRALGVASTGGRIVAGGGAVEMALSSMLRQAALKMAGKEQAVVCALGRALEVIPRQLAMNAGFDATTILNWLRHKHTTEDGTWYGVDILNEGIADNYAAGIWEPSLIKSNAISGAIEAAALILSVDETIKNPKAAQAGSAMAGGRPAMG